MAAPDPGDDLYQGLASGLLGADPVSPVAGLGAALMQGLDARTTGIPSATTIPPSAAASPPGGNPDFQHQVQTIYGETAGVYPQLQAGKTGLYNPQHWDADSAAQLKLAREWMAGVRLRNPTVHESRADQSNGIERMVWNDANDAALAAQGLQLPSGVDHFNIRQEGQGVQYPPKWGKPYKSFGPFINVGGDKHTPAGNKTYIDFYQGVK